MAAFATSAQLRTWLGDSTFDADRADLLLESASQMIRREARQTFDLVTDDVVDLRGTWNPVLILPERPVVDVTAVAIQGVATDGWRLIRDELHRIGPTQDLFDDPHLWNWGGTNRKVTVTYSHGYATIPDDIVALTLTAAARGAVNAAGFQSVAVGESYRVSFGAGRSHGVALTKDERDYLRKAHGRGR